MNEGTDQIRIHFLDGPENETADGFLKRRLLFLEDYFSYEELSGLSRESLQEELVTFR